MKLWTSVRCDLPPEIQMTYELFLSYENLKISLKLVHKKRDLKLFLLNIIILNFSTNVCVKQDQDAPPPPPPFAILIKMEIRIRHNLYLQLCNLIFSYFKIKWTQLFENQNIQKGLQNTALFSLRVCALQQRWIIVWKNSCVSKFPTSSHPISLINDPSFLSDLPSGMRDWNSSHRRPLCYLYLFTEDYNAQGYLNKDGMKAIWSKKG